MEPRESTSVHNDGETIAKISLRRPNKKKTTVMGFEGYSFGFQKPGYAFERI
jgi:hypothetical protein